MHIYLRVGSLFFLKNGGGPFHYNSIPKLGVAVVM